MRLEDSGDHYVQDVRQAAGDQARWLMASSKTVSIRLASALAFAVASTTVAGAVSYGNAAFFARSQAGTFGDHFQRSNIFNAWNDDPREPVDVSREKQLKPVARLGDTTAFLVSPCYALTANHSLYASVVTLLIPDDYKEGTVIYKAVEARPEMRGQGQSIRDDWALLRLAVCEGKRVGWLELSDTQDRDPYNKRVSIAGYPNDKPKTQLWRDQTGEISNVGSDILRDCLLNSAATRGGNSGSPIYDEGQGRGIPKVMGIQVRARQSAGEIIRQYNELIANVAIDIRHIRTRIDRVISADKNVFWGENQALAGKNPAH